MDIDNDAVWAAQLGQLAKDVGRMTGNPVQIVEHTRDSFVALLESDSALTINLQADGRELVEGSSPNLAQNVAA